MAVAIAQIIELLRGPLFLLYQTVTTANRQLLGKSCRARASLAAPFALVFVFPGQLHRQSATITNVYLDCQNLMKYRAHFSVSLCAGRPRFGKRRPGSSCRERLELMIAFMIKLIPSQRPNKQPRPVRSVRRVRFRPNHFSFNAYLCLLPVPLSVSK